MSLFSILNKLRGKNSVAPEQLDEAYTQTLAELLPLVNELVLSKKHIDREYINFSTKQIYQSFARLHIGFRPLWREFKQAKKIFQRQSNALQSKFDFFILLWQQKIMQLLTQMQHLDANQQSPYVKSLFQAEMDLVSLHGYLLNKNILKPYTLRKISLGPPQDTYLHVTIANYAPNHYRKVHDIEERIDAQVYHYFAIQHFHAEPEQMLTPVLPEYFPAFLTEKYKLLAERIFWQTALTDNKQPPSNVAHACIWVVMQCGWYKHGHDERITTDNNQYGLVEWHDVHHELDKDKIRKINICVNKLITCFHNQDLNKLLTVKIGLDRNLIDLILLSAKRMDNSTAREFLKTKLPPNEYAKFFS